jgi:hypothetical protein
MKAIQIVRTGRRGADIVSDHIAGRSLIVHTA